MRQTLLLGRGVPSAKYVFGGKGRRPIIFQLHHNRSGTLLVVVLGGQRKRASREGEGEPIMASGRYNDAGWPQNACYRSQTINRTVADMHRP
ncbi:hypothetical protein LSTR_LSTR011675 [Laodelphax striatellus]|uniref:Uncharacterized protein n=1 Tax=Laodelphax striatellus TaxID=195883 RepID=A0A482WMV1_LAOST|nr:hypothetical protein LSTR_LSTR016310 [Laodelphax striatellus]RZF37398.1 hypothetical protein LSTR_LSTR011675 [Laodelphax striatellus]